MENPLRKIHKFSSEIYDKNLSYFIYFYKSRVIVSVCGKTESQLFYNQREAWKINKMRYFIIFKKS